MNPKNRAVQGYHRQLSRAMSKALKSKGKFVFLLSVRKKGESIFLGKISRLPCLMCATIINFD
jgi:hypothetical protein